MMHRPVRKFFREVRRRRVFRVVIIYAIVAWLVVQIAATTFPHLELPNWSITLVIVIAILGFPLAVVLAWAYDITPSGIVRTEPAGTTTKPAGETEATGPGEHVADYDTDAEASPRPHSIAVLPFADLSPDHDQEYFADGIAEELLNALARVPDLRVPARTSCFAFKGQNRDISEIGRTLRVNSVLEGSIRKSGDRLRITVQLIGVRDGYHLWSERYDRQVDDVFAVQEEIARAVVDAVGLTLDERDRRAIRCVPAENFRSYEYYLRGRQFQHHFSRRDFENAVRMFEEAIRLDPGFARAWAGLADCHASLYLYFDRDETHVDRARATADKALELEPDLAEAHVARGHALVLGRRYDEAEVQFKSAIELDPRLYEAYYFYARASWMQNRLADAVRMFEKAHDLQPDEYQALCLATSAYKRLGDAAALESAQRRALEAIERHLKFYPGDARAYYLGAGCWSGLGDVDKARDWAKRALEFDPEDASVAYNVACIYAGIGDVDDALDQLERAWSIGHTPRDWVENDPDLDPIRDHPRFKDLVERHG